MKACSDISNRFTVLHHESPSGDHWDLLFESGDALETWSVPPRSSPVPGEFLESFRCPATRQPDHRSIYLDYEGPVSGNRGFVRRVDTGTYEKPAPDRFRLDGTIFHGVVSFEGFDENDLSATLIFERIR